MDESICKQFNELIQNGLKHLDMKQEKERTFSNLAKYMEENWNIQGGKENEGKK